ncbi:NERD domain-containing protein [Ruminococcus sp. OA3]|uniref:nuclease-related domain-containing protein n=1 Tax=Ruminococcus sp. OA3 TaxID=2914164 RepID=UPI001F06AF1C|nr:nuclease-related domain-containing protein [Ruminococcus sp. OA3]MCH1981795.1 NERD domain-containing protein [Ruminococcus sp. OA3]
MDQLANLATEFFVIVVFIVTIVVGIQVYIQNKRYKNSSYGKQSKISFFKIIEDKGARGEYRTSYELEKANFYKKFIFNCYVPNYKNELTEIDIIMLSTKGIFVVENKNYAGWIFGDENSKNWCQTLNGKKSFFYNPIKQNKSHIKNLNRVLEQDIANLQSLITFNRSELKKIAVESDNIHVMNINQIKKFISKCNKQENIYTEEEVNDLHNKLIPYTQVSEEDKQKHIERIKNTYKK